MQNFSPFFFYFEVFDNFAKSWQTAVLCSRPEVSRSRPDTKMKVPLTLYIAQDRDQDQDKPESRDRDWSSTQHCKISIFTCDLGANSDMDMKKASHSPTQRRVRDVRFGREKIPRAKWCEAVWFRTTMSAGSYSSISCSSFIHQGKWDTEK